MQEFDAIVIGTGPAGQVCAGELAGAGMSVAAIEAELVGGECAFYACMPSKALLRPEELRREVSRVPGLQPGADGPLSPSAVLKRRDEVIRHLDDAQNLPWLEERDIDLIRGEARLEGPLEVSVAAPNGEPQRQLRARRAVILATGSAAAMPPIKGLGEVGPWNNRQGTTAREVPSSLIVLGGGPVGCELAQAWASLGTEVTLAEAGDRLLSGEEPFASELVAESLADLGVGIVTGHELREVGRSEDGELDATLSDGRLIRAAEIVVAVGRRPRTEGLNLESVGLPGSGPVEVDDYMRALGATDPGEAGPGGRRPWLYAVGDVNGRALLTHMGKYQAKIAVADILGEEYGQGPRVLAETAGSPRVTFTDPQIAAVGLTESAARERSLNIVIAETSTSGTPGASFYGRETAGVSRLIVDADRRVVVGATFAGFNTAEMLHAATVAIAGEVPVDRLRHAVPAFPTRSEIWLRLLDQLP